ncbi:MAG: XisH family protein [Synechococcales bacterium]|nr:XisH family protein [Synechococcales bacterium]
MAKDFFHPVVKATLIQEGWDVTDDPLEIKVGGVDMEIDLGAEQIIAAERKGQKIAVEVKSFLTGTSAISEFHRALGQFINYRAALKTEMPDRILYLAVPFMAFNTFFQLDFPKSRVEENQVKLLIYDTLSQRELLWIPEITHK